MSEKNKEAVATKISGKSTSQNANASKNSAKPSSQAVSPKKKSPSQTDSKRQMSGSKPSAGNGSKKQPANYKKPSKQSQKEAAKRRKRKKTKKKIKNFIKIYKIPIIITAFLLIVTAVLGGIIIYQNYQKKIDLVETYVDSACAEFGVPKSLVMAIIKTESDFDVYAESGANARGLMQITEITLKEINNRQGTSYRFAEMFDPEININCGVFYLSYLYQRFGDYETVFAAYNAGPTIVDTWLSDSRYSKEGKLTSIPYPETDRYVEKVLRYWDEYKKIYK